jgi:hypothetical protein
MSDLTKSDRDQIADVLSRRSNEIASYLDDYRKDSNHFGSVELALTREIQRLRRLADKLNPPIDDQED